MDSDKKRGWRYLQTNVKLSKEYNHLVKIQTDIIGDVTNPVVSF